MTPTADLIEVAYGADILRFDPTAHEYWINDVEAPSTSYYLKQAGYVRAYNGDRSAAWRGRHVHTATFYYDLNDLDEAQLDPALRGYVEGWKRFKAECAFVPDMRLRERPIFHPIYRHAGTPDAPGTKGGKRAVVEIKTGAPEKWHAVQVGGSYTPMVAAHYPEYVGAESWLVYLQDDGSYQPLPVVDKQLPLLFASMVATVNGRTRYGYHA